MKTQMQLSWIHIKMLDQSVKSQASGYKCNSSNTYDSCIYSTVTNAMKSRTKSKCTVPWVPDNKVICKTWLEMNASYWEHYNRITNQQVWNVEVKVYSLHKS